MEEMQITQNTEPSRRRNAPNTEASLREALEISQTLLSIGHQITSDLNFDTVLDFTLRKATELCAADEGTFYYSAELARVKARESAGNKVIPMTPAMRAETEKLEYQDSREIRIEERAECCLMTVPIRSRSVGLAGVLELKRSRRRRFQSKEIELARGIGSLAAVAIDHAQWFARAQSALDARDEFLGIASHELNTPLTPLLSNIQCIRKVLADSNSFPERAVLSFAESAEKQVKKLASLLDALLDASNLGRGVIVLDRETVELETLVRNVIRSLEPLHRASSCEIEFKSAGPITGHWDRTRIEQLVENVILNAIKHAPGPIDVELDVCGSEALFIVKDKGPGIPPEHRAGIFELYERAGISRNHGGLGLGLFIVKQVVEAHGGQVEVESEPGEGTEFLVRLPLIARVDEALV